MKLRLFFFQVGLALVSCAEPPPDDDTSFVHPDPEPQPARPPVVPPRDGGVDADAGSRHVDGTLLVSGKVNVVGVTDDGWVAYFLTGASGTKTFEVFDTKTKKRVSFGVAGSVNDTAMVRGNAVALWTNLRAPYGWGGLTVWTEASGVTIAQNAKSLPGLFVTNDDTTRLAFTSGLPPDKGGIMQLATSAPASIASPQIIAGNVGIGTDTARCIPVIGFRGARLFTSACEGVETSATVRMIDASGAVTTVATNARPSWSADANGNVVLVTSGSGAAELHTMPNNDVVPVATGVSSAVLAPDGTAILYTTADSALRRAPTATPSSSTTLVASGAREILSVAPDGAHAVVASLPPDPSSTSTHRTDLKLVSLALPSTPTALLATATGMPYGFTRSGSHVLYITDLTGIGFEGMKLRARPVAGGAEILLGEAVRGVVQPAGSTKVLYSERRKDYALDVKVVDLEGGSPPKLLIDDVESATAFGGLAYVGVGTQGLYAIPLP